MMPKGWEKDTLENVLDKIIDYRGQSVPKAEIGIPLITARNVREGYLDFSTKEFVDETEYDNWMTRGMPKSGDVLITTEAPLGMVAMYPCDNKKYAVGQRTVTLRPSQKLDSNYLMYYLLGPGNKEIQDRATGSTAKGIKSSELRKVTVIYPEKKEQAKISKVLSTWDHAIKKIEDEIQLKSQAKLTLASRLLTGKKRFKEFQSIAFDKVQLKDKSIIRRGASPRPINDPKWFADQGRGWVRISDVTSEPSRYLSRTTQYLSDLAVDKSVPVDPGDLIMSICATIGVPKILSIKACIHDGFVLFRDFEKSFNKYFLYHYLGMITDRLANSGQPGTQKNLNSEIVGKIEVPLFTIKEQIKIVSVLNSADEEILLLKKILSSLKTQKYGLMQQLLTGNKRVKV